MYIIPTIANLVSVFGGGWGYSGKSCDAILFTAEKEILLNGLNLYGGRGNYAAKLKVQRRLRSLKRYLTFSRLLGILTLFDLSLFDLYPHLRYLTLGMEGQSLTVI